MAVYVDGAKNTFGRMTTCHMLADTTEELHAMADKIGLKREWYQKGGTPHYDLSLSRRKLAIQNGAIEISNKKVVQIIQVYRKNA